MTSKMTGIFPVVALVTIMCLAAGCAGLKGPSCCADAGWVSIFDGETLAGWTQLNGTASYKVEDGTIVGRTTVGSPNSFLCSDKNYCDFELQFEVKCDTGLNSGVQIRSAQKEVENVDPNAKADKNNKEGRVFGPQVEIEGSPGQSGYVYGEATGLKWLSPEPGSKDPLVKEHSHFKNDEWNHFRIIAKGPRIQTFINGQQIADLTHDEIYGTHPKGFLGLQVHGIKADAGPYKVAWRNIKIRKLEGCKEGSASK